MSLHRSFRFTLKLLIVAITLFCIALAIWSHRAREQRSAIQRIREESGESDFGYDFQVDAHEPEKAKSHVPRWLIDRLGVDYFHTIRVAGVFHPSALPHLERLRGLRDLILQCHELTDEQATTLARLKNLAYLGIASGQGPSLKMTERSFEHIGSLPKLEGLMMEVEEITQARIEALAKSQSLRWVELEGRFVEDDVAEPFRRAGRVSYLQIRQRGDGGSWLVERWDNR